MGGMDGSYGGTWAVTASLYVQIMDYGGLRESSNLVQAAWCSWARHPLPILPKKKKEKIIKYKRKNVCVCACACVSV